VKRSLLPLIALAAALPAAASAQPAQPQTAPAAEQAQQGGGSPGEKNGPAQAAAGDLKPGAPVVDGKGQAVGKIETADGSGAVVTTGAARARLNLDAFYKNGHALVIGYTRAQFEELAGGKGSSE
jgi:hypothetical protein